MSQELQREFSLRDLILFHITAIVTVRWISLGAARGPTSMGLWTLSFFLFLLPIIYAVIDFSRKMPEQGGLYQWTKKTLGPFHGFICAWCYIINNLFYFPSLLVTVAGYSAWSVGRQGLENNIAFVGWFATACIVGVVILNYVGLKIGKWIENIGGLSIWIPCTVLIIFGGIHFFRHGSAAPLSFSGMLPDFTKLDTLTAWSNICFAFTGIELASTMSGEIKNPEKNLPRSIYLGGAIITAIYMLGTLAVLVLVPPGKINIVTGIVQAIDSILTGIGVPQLTPLVALLLTLGGLGTLGAWIAGTARMPYSVGVDRYFPAALAKTHPRFRTPYISLIWLGIVSLGIMLIAIVGSTVKEFYLILANACLILYFIPYIYLFVSHIVYNLKNERKPLAVVLAVCGIFSTVIAIVLTLIPPPETRPGHYLGNVLGGCLVFLAIGLIIYWVRSKKSKIPA